MPDILSEALQKLHRRRTRKLRLLSILLVLSLLVSLDVFWTLRQPGLTLAGNADCGMTEHTHSDACQNADTPCPLTEHVHTIACYSDETADVEDMLDWQEMFKNYPYTGAVYEDLAGIAKTQVGYQESTKNFEVNQDGVRHGYTRYGAWYGTPYGDWSATFVSFCLHYAGASPAKFPANTGANSMAQQWKALGKYAAVGNYTPLKGDLVFFKNNTVGIVVETFKTSVYIVRGDMDGSVQTSLISMVDNSVAGFGKTRNYLSTTDLLDISNGPAVYIFDSGSPATQSMSTYSLRSTYSARTAATEENLISYLNKTDGTFYITLLDMDDHEVPKNHDGSYIVDSDTNYKITFSSSAPNGFKAGTYVYQLPAEVDITSSVPKPLKLDDGTEVGTWEISDGGLIKFNFTTAINDRSEVIISATMGINFPAQDEPIDFDGIITVTVEKANQEITHTTIVKWGDQGDPNNVAIPTKNEKLDPDKIYWTVEIKGHKDSSIPGSTITDNPTLQDWSKKHYYSESDMARGITFGVSLIADGSTEMSWHKWTVYPGDENLTWTEDGWSYQMPETVNCGICGGHLTLGSDGCTYYVEYTSTPEDIDIAGALHYTNEITVDNQRADGWASHTQTHVHTTINKNGAYIADANAGKFVWEVQVTIPGSTPGTPCEYFWNIVDEQFVVNQNKAIVDYVANNLPNATVTANYYGTTINVPYIDNASDDDPYAFAVWPWADKHIHQLIFLKQCDCKEHPETCGRADSGGCWYYWPREDLFCDCWTETEDTTFTITYDITDMNILKAYNSKELYMLNKATLTNGGQDKLETSATIPIPNIIGKQWISASDDYIVKYKISVNESKIMLNDGSPITIHDEMTNTLSFIRGSLIVTSVDADGNQAELLEGIDYEYRYSVDPEHNDHDDDEHKHVLEIDILHPQPVTYYLEYDTIIVVQAGAGTIPIIKYENSASISLWNLTFTGTTAQKTYTNVNLASKRFGVEIVKKSDTGEKLEGVTFGLFNEQGHLIITGASDSEGKILFATDVMNGIVLKEHVLYYVQELEALPGYRLDDTKHWFAFCNTTDGTCTALKDVIEGTAIRIPYSTIGELDITNEPVYYDLPATGGIGIYPFILASAILILAPLVYRFVRRRKRERRGVG